MDNLNESSKFLISYTLSNFFSICFILLFTTSAVFVSEVAVLLLSVEAEQPAKTKIVYKDII